MSSFFTKLDTETDYMLFEPGERRTTLAEQEAILDAFTRDVGAITKHA